MCFLWFEVTLDLDKLSPNFRAFTYKIKFSLKGLDLLH